MVTLAFAAPARTSVAVATPAATAVTVLAAAGVSGGLAVVPAWADWATAWAGVTARWDAATPDPPSFVLALTGPVTG